jgi:hypothetical protein
LGSDRLPNLAEAERQVIGRFPNVTTGNPVDARRMRIVQGRTFGKRQLSAILLPRHCGASMRLIKTRSERTRCDRPIQTRVRA